MSRRLCLDTSAYSHFKRGKTEAVSLVDAAEWIGVPAIVLGELWAGFLHGAKREANLAELRMFLAHSIVEPIGVDADVAQIYGELVTDLRQAGTPIPTNDVWIAAIAVRHGAPLVTYDHHFRVIHRVGSIVLESQ